MGKDKYGLKAEARNKLSAKMYNTKALNFLKFCISSVTYYLQVGTTGTGIVLYQHGMVIIFGLKSDVMFFKKCAYFYESSWACLGLVRCAVKK